MKKLQALSLICFIALLASCQGHNSHKRDRRAHDQHKNMTSEGSTEDRLDNLEARVDQISQQNVHQTYGGRNPPHLTQNGPFVTADFLYWTADEDGLSYASKISGVQSSSPNVDTTIKVLDLDFEWDPGFRLGFGWLFGDFDQWDLYLNWTYFHTDADDSVGSDNTSTEFLTPAWSPAVLGDFLSNASAKWQLAYDTLDLELGRSYFISKLITLRPHIGFRAVWIEQDYHAHYTPINSSPINPVFGAPTLLPTTFKGDCDYGAFGIRGGANLLWHINHHWGVIGQFSAALLYGEFEVTEKLEANSINNTTKPPTPSSTDLRFKDEYWRTRANIQGLVGIQFESELFHNKHYIEVSLGYEFLEWFQQNELFQFPLGACCPRQTSGFVPGEANGLGGSTDGAPAVYDYQHGDLGLKGLTLSIKYSF